MIEKIIHNEKLLGIIINNTFRQDGIVFFTEDNFSQQLGYMSRPQGYVIPPHRHILLAREVVQTQEVLFIKSGKVRVDFYDDDQQYLDSRIVQKGDVILLASGGHGFEMLEESEMIEVKQGPYIGERDKVRFDHVEPHKVIIK
jgi:mannose-6-phosphate isomerase-like protein (cupin superfamily)